MSKDLVAVKSAKLLAADSTVFSEFIGSFGLPTDNVIAADSEREILAQNLPIFLESLPPEEKKEARYLSKFVGAAAIGLFDAALNYVWNEVITNLQKKAVVYGLELFYDAAVGGSLRDSYQDEDDFRALKDRTIIDTFRKLELISDVVYRKLEHILTMRNEVAASHPNVEQIGAFELMGWLQTCVKDILQDRPSQSAIQVTALVGNLKKRTEILDEQTVSRFESEARNLSLPHVHNLLVTIFGMYAASDTQALLRKNVSLIAPSVWRLSTDRVRYKIGERIDGYRTNLQQDKLERGIEFLRVVDGLNFESLPQREVALTRLAAKLIETHQGWDNFHHEPAVMREILRYCQKTEDIPEGCLAPLCEAVVRCRIGNGVDYKSGVSPNAKPMYEVFLALLDDSGIEASLLFLMTPEMLQKLNYTKCISHLPDVLAIFKERVISDRLRSAIALLSQNPSKPAAAIASRGYRELLTPLVGHS